MLFTEIDRNQKSESDKQVGKVFPSVNTPIVSGSGNTPSFTKYFHRQRGIIVRNDDQWHYQRRNWIHSVSSSSCRFENRNYPERRHPHVRLSPKYYDFFVVTVEKVPGIQGKFKPGDRVYVEPVSQPVHNETLTSPPAASEKDFDKTRPDSDVY